MSNLIAIAALTSTLAGTPDAVSWELIVDQEDAKVYKRDLPDTSLVNFRGVGLVYAPIGKLVTIAMTPARYPEWTAMLAEVELVERFGPFDFVVWEHYDETWPITDRDFVYRTTGQIEPEQLAFAIRYGSIPRPDVPDRDCCVRGEIINTYMHLTALGDGSTHVEVEALIDPKGWIPTFLVNLVQEDWPMTMLTSLRGQVTKPDVAEHPEFVGWHEQAARAMAASAVESADASPALEK